MAFNISFDADVVGVKYVKKKRLQYSLLTDNFILFHCMFCVSVHVCVMHDAYMINVLLWIKLKVLFVQMKCSVQ